MASYSLWCDMENVKKVNQENELNFLSMREAFNSLKTTSEKLSETEITRLLCKVLILDTDNHDIAELNTNGAIKSINNRKLLELSNLLRRIGNEKISIADLPIWFRTYLPRKHLALNDAVNTIIKLDSQLNVEHTQYITNMLKEAVTSEKIKEDSYSYLDGSYSALDINDIKKVCDETGFYFPLPPKEDNNHHSSIPNDSTQVNELQNKVKELEKQLKKIEDENKLLKQQLDNSYSIINRNEIIFPEINHALKIVALTQEKFYHPEKIDKKDYDTHTNKKEIIAWLKTEHRLNDNNANAVDRIAKTIKRKEEHEGSFNY